MQFQAFDVDEWWNLVQDLLKKCIHGLFDEHKVDEANYTRKLKAYQEAYFNFLYESPFTTLEDNFDTLNFLQFKVIPNEEVVEEQSTSLVEMKGGDTINEITREQVDIHLDGHIIVETTIVQEQSILNSSISLYLSFQCIFVPFYTQDFEDRNQSIGGVMLRI